jgi:hypothetical protein
MVGFRSLRRRRGFAATACVLWLLGVELLPNLHLAFHEDDHTHGEAGEIVVAHVAIEDHSHAQPDEPHEHGDAHHSELAYDEGDVTVVVEEPAPPRRKHRDRLAIDDRELAHAASGLAHRQAALHRPAPPLLAPLPVVRTSWWVIDAPIERTYETSLARPTARGPPLA